MKSTENFSESDVSYLEVDAVFNLEPVELLEESTWTAWLRRTGNDTGEEVLCFLEFGYVLDLQVAGFRFALQQIVQQISVMGFELLSSAVST